MGYNTQLIIMNDAFDQIEAHPNLFVRGIKAKMHEGGDIAVGGHVNAATVMPTRHADVFRTLGSHGNLMLELSPHNDETLALVRRDEDMARVVEGYVRRAKADLSELEHAIKMERAMRRGDL